MLQTRRVAKIVNECSDIYFLNICDKHPLISKNNIIRYTKFYMCGIDFKTPNVYLKKEWRLVDVADLLVNSDLLYSWAVAGAVPTKEVHIRENLDNLVYELCHHCPLQSIEFR